MSRLKVKGEIHFMFNWQTACKRKIQEWRSYCTTEKRKPLLPSALVVCHLWCPLQSCTTHRVTGTPHWVTAELHTSPGDSTTGTTHPVHHLRCPLQSCTTHLVTGTPHQVTAELHISPGDRNTSPGDCWAAHLTWWQEHLTGWLQSGTPHLVTGTPHRVTAERHTSPGDRNTSPGDCRAEHLTWWWEHLTGWLQNCTPHSTTGVTHPVHFGNCVSLKAFSATRLRRTVRY